MECDVVFEVVIGRPYLWDQDATFVRRVNKWRVVKDGKPYLIKGYEWKKIISLIIDFNQPI